MKRKNGFSHSLFRFETGKKEIMWTKSKKMRGTGKKLQELSGLKSNLFDFGMLGSTSQSAATDISNSQTIAFAIALNIE